MMEVNETVADQGGAFIRRIYSNTTKLSYRRVIVECPKLKMIMVQYYYKDAPEEPFEPPKYQRSYKSTRDEIKKLADQGELPRLIRARICTTICDITELESPAQLPGAKQIHNHNSNNKPSKEEDYNLFTVECMEKARQPDAFVREVVTAPSFLAVLCADRQLDDLVRFGTIDWFSADTTFEIGDYYVTLVICFHKFLKNKLHGNYPIVIGPAFIHKRKDKLAYRRMMAQLLFLRPEIRRAKLFGTDGDMAMYGAFQDILPDSKHVLCMVHFTENLKRKLKELNLSTFAQEVIELLLGKKIAKTRLQGYVHCETDQDYRALEPLMRERFLATHPNGKIFAHYFFDEKAPMIRQHYSVEIQKLVGINGDHFSTNANESANAMIKRDMHLYRSLCEFTKDLKETIIAQTREFELAVIGEGLYQIVPQYGFPEVPFRKFSEWSHDRKVQTKEKFHTEAYDPNRPLPDVVSLDVPEQKLLWHKYGGEIVKIKVVSPQLLLQMVETADDILAIENPVSPVQKQIRANIFSLLRTKNIVLRVTLDQETGKAECDVSCKYYLAFGICPELFALAMHLDAIAALVSWTLSGTFANTGKFGLHKLMNGNAAENSGKKPSGTAIRRGPKARAIPATKLDNVSLLDNLTQASSSQGVAGKRARNDDDDNSASKRLPQYSRLANRQKLWERMTTAKMGEKRHPQPNEYEIWMLKDVDARTSLCSGCGWKFRKNKELPGPLNDFVAVAVGKRRYDPKHGESKTASKAGNIYFYVNKKCIADGVERMDVVQLRESSVLISEATKAQLREAHEARLWHLFQ